jgi:hypothetical protein
MSVEFPYAALPRSAWERDLTHLKEMGVLHVSLPSSGDDAQLDDVIRIVRRLGMEADLEGAIPDRLQPLAKPHGGPLTDALPGPVRIQANMPRALDNERKLISSGTPSIIWTEVFETLRPAYHPGAITLAGVEGPGSALIRREATIAHFWGSQLSELPELPGARLAIPTDSVSVHQYIADGPTPGLSLTSMVNNSSDPWKGEVRVMYPALQRPIALPEVALAPYEVLWLPVNIPLTASPLCSGCTGFGTSDHLAYATAELTGMEYENGVLAMEFIAASPGEAILQLSREPTGPLLAAGHPSSFDWDPKTLRARLKIPAGNAKTGRVRVALAIDAPPATAFFDSATVLLIGESNRLTAQFSPPATAARSRVRSVPDLAVSQEPIQAGTTPEDKDKPAQITYKIAVPATAVPGDTAHLSIEADGVQLSHSQLPVLPPATVTFEDAIAVRVAEASMVPLEPATIAVNQKPGREIVISLRNNAPEIRTFDVSMDVPGLDFSPAKLTVSVGALVAREIKFRVFSSSATPGRHDGEIRISGAAALSEPVSFVVFPPAGSIMWSSAEGFSILENAKLRASFLRDRWLEMLDKDSGNDSQPAGGTPYNGAPVESLKMEDLQKLVTPRSEAR